MSRLHRVRAADGPGRIEVEDADGTVHTVSLLAWEGPAPAPGEWVTVHSGYALERVDAEEAEATAALLRGAGAPGAGEPG